MILGCYRSGEVDENSLLYNKIAGIREKSGKHGFSMMEMEIGPSFQVHNIEEVIAKTMPCGDETNATDLLNYSMSEKNTGKCLFRIGVLKDASAGATGGVRPVDSYMGLGLGQD